ncbi:hypothetical protein BLD44_020415 [Mastigocladus laminosus UU774]|nr:hypothetical protein BLD44_020415 [Mastigocladus laminosus UU774]
MIGFFPDPLWDELLYSVCSRYQDYMQYPSKTAVAVELQGYAGAKAVIDLPWNLNRLVAALPPANRYTVERLANHHTLLPFYSPFFHSHEQDSRLEMMRASGGSMFYQIFSLFTAGISFTTKLKFCPVCAIEDSQQFGEPYWHRLHQVPGVQVCPIHQVFLTDSGVDTRTHQPKCEFVCARNAVTTNCSATPIDSQSYYHQVLLKIATDAAWLLSLPYNFLNLEFIYQRYLYLISQTFPDPTNRAAVNRDLLEMLTIHYSHDLLKSLRCSLEISLPHHCWLFKLLRPQSSCHPLHHLLFIQFWGFTALGRTCVKLGNLIYFQHFYISLVEAAARGFVVSYTILDSQTPLAAKVAQFYILSMKVQQFSQFPLEDTRVNDLFTLSN